MVALPTAIDYGFAGSAAGPATLTIGSRAPRFERLLGTDGHYYGLADFADKDYIVLLFTANRCPTAKSHSQRLAEFQAKYERRGVQLVLINSNEPHLYPAESYAGMVSLAKERGYSFPYLADQDQRVARDYGAKCTFHAFVLDRNRRVRYQGRFDDARVAANVMVTDVADAVDDLLDGRDVRVPVTTPFGCSLDIVNNPNTESASRSLVDASLLALIGVAWLTMTAAQVTGLGAALHHGALIENGPPLPVAAAASTLGWLVMTVGMMLPSSLRAIRAFASDRAEAGAHGVAGFLGGYFAIWAVFGLGCFLGDSVVHRMVDSSQWLSQHGYLITAGVVASAGAYQLLPFKNRCLVACRNPLAASHRGKASLVAGGAHALDCILSSGPLMLLMFAAGIANLWWMAALTALMLYETVGRNGRAVGRVAGFALIGLALLVVTTPGIAAVLAD